MLFRDAQTLLRARSDRDLVGVGVASGLGRDPWVLRDRPIRGGLERAHQPGKRRDDEVDDILGQHACPTAAQEGDD